MYALYIRINLTLKFFQAICSCKGQRTGLTAHTTPLHTDQRSDPADVQHLGPIPDSDKWITAFHSSVQRGFLSFQWKCVWCLTSLQRIFHYSWPAFVIFMFSNISRSHVVVSCFFHVFFSRVFVDILWLWDWRCIQELCGVLFNKVWSPNEANVLHFHSARLPHVNKVHAGVLRSWHLKQKWNENKRWKKWWILING